MLQSEFPPLLRLGIGQHDFPEHGNSLQALLVVHQEVLQLGQELLPLSREGELKNQIVVFQDANQDLKKSYREEQSQSSWADL